MTTFTKEQLIEELKTSTQNASGMFEISEDTICDLMSMLTTTPAPVSVPDDYFSSLVAAARVRADKAMRKFPQPNYVLNKVAEESGEVIKAVIHFTEGREEWQNVEGEIIDNLAMLIRLVMEGDQVIGFTPPDACRAAMIQSEPVNQPSSNHPSADAVVGCEIKQQSTNEHVTQIKPVADLYEVTVPGGRSTTFTTDAAEAKYCADMGWKVQEYVKLERYQSAMLQGKADVTLMHEGENHPEDKLDMVDHSGDGNKMVAGNSPVMPNGYVLVPKEITCAMDDAAWEAYHETRCMSDIWAALLAAAPQQEVK